MTTIGVAATATYLPERWMTAAEIGEASGIPEDVIVEKFGLRGKHIAADDEQTSDLALAAARRLIEETETDPTTLDAVVYYGSTWKDHPVWQLSPLLCHELGATNAFGLELEYVSCGTPVALRVCRDMMLAERELERVLIVAACRESHLIDYRNERARFTYNFGDGAVAGLLEKGGPNPILGAHMVTDGSFAMDVLVPAGGTVEPASHETVERGRHTLDVPDPRGMKERLDPKSLPNFLAAAEGALGRSGHGLTDVDHYCGIHMKRSMHDDIVAALDVPEDRAPYPDDTGHMSGVDPLLLLDRSARAGDLTPGDLVLLLAAGTGYTWAAATVRWNRTDER